MTVIKYYVGLGHFCNNESYKEQNMSKMPFYCYLINENTKIRRKKFILQNI